MVDIDLYLTVWEHDLERQMEAILESFAAQRSEMRGEIVERASEQASKHLLAWLQDDEAVAQASARGSAMEK